MYRPTSKATRPTCFQVHAIPYFCEQLTFVLASDGDIMWTMNKCLVAVASFLLLLPLQTGATYFKNNDDLTCTYPVTVETASMACGESELCGFGDELTVSGSMILAENLDSSEMCVTTKICAMGSSWVCKTEKNKVDICNAVGLSNSYDGTPCPNAGEFYFGSTVTLPGRSFMNLGSGKSCEVFLRRISVAFRCSASDPFVALRWFSLFVV
jgi:hypothetical protein